jgi:hypothetical protein
VCSGAASVSLTRWVIERRFCRSNRLERWFFRSNRKERCFFRFNRCYKSVLSTPSEMAMGPEAATLKAVTAEEEAQFGPLVGHCVLCQEPVHAWDLLFDPTGFQNKPLCAEREVPDQWQAPFKGKSCVFLCSRKPMACTKAFVEKLNSGTLVSSHGFDLKYAASLDTNQKVLRALKGQEDVPDLEDEAAPAAEPPAAAYDQERVNEESAIMSPEKFSKGLQKALHKEKDSEKKKDEEKTEEKEDEEQDKKSEPSAAAPAPAEPEAEAAPAAAAAAVELEQYGPQLREEAGDAPAEEEAEADEEAAAEQEVIETFEETRPTVEKERGAPAEGEAATEEPEAKLQEVALVEGERREEVPKGKPNAEAKPETPVEAVGADGGALKSLSPPLPSQPLSTTEPPKLLEDLAQQQATKAAAAAKASSALLTQWTTMSIRRSSMEEMNAIITKEGVTKEDVVELCSSGSHGTYADVWAQNQGKHCSSWVPSLSSSIAVPAVCSVLSDDEQRQEDRHAPSAIPRVIISSKVMFPTAVTDSKKQTRCASPPVTRRPRLCSLVSLLTPRCSGLQTGSSALCTSRSTRSWQRTPCKTSSPPLSTWRWAPRRTNRGCAAI